MKFFVGIGSYQLDLGHCCSLKDKRQIIKSVVDRIGKIKGCGAAEVGAQDIWKNGSVAVTCTSTSYKMVVGMLDNARKTIESCGVEIINEAQWIVNPEDLTVRLWDQEE